MYIGDCTDWSKLRSFIFSVQAFMNVLRKYMIKNIFDRPFSPYFMTTISLTKFADK